MTRLSRTQHTNITISHFLLILLRREQVEIILNDVKDSTFYWWHASQDDSPHSADYTPDYSTNHLKPVTSLTVPPLATWLGAGINTTRVRSQSHNNIRLREHVDITKITILYSRADLPSVTLVGLPHLPHQPGNLQPLHTATPVSEGANLVLLQRTEMVA